MEPETTSSPALLEAEWSVPDVLVLLAPPLAWRAALHAFGDRLTPALSVAASAFLLGWLFLPLVLARRRPHRPSPPRPRPPRRWFVEAPIGFGLAFASYGLVVVLTVLLVRATGAEDPPPVVPASAGLAWVLIFAFFAVAIGPVAEEVFFRGFLYGALRARMPRPAAALLQAALFAVVHPFPAVVLPAIFVLGLLFALVLDWRRTLVAPVAFHVGFNGISTAIVVLVLVSNWWTSPILGIQGEARPGEGWEVVSVVPGSGAEEAGLAPGDRVVTVDGSAVDSHEEVREAVRAHAIGEAVPVEFERGPERRTVTVRLRRAPFPWW